MGYFVLGYGRSEEDSIPDFHSSPPRDETAQGAAAARHRKSMNPPGTDDHGRAISPYMPTADRLKLGRVYHSANTIAVSDYLDRARSKGCEARELASEAEAIKESARFDFMIYYLPSGAALPTVADRQFVNMLKAALHDDEVRAMLRAILAPAPAKTAELKQTPPLK